MSLGETISRIRKQKNLKQAELANTLGVNQSIIARWENDQMRPRKKSLEHLALALEVPYEELLVEDAANSIRDLKGLNPDLADLLQHLPKLAEDQIGALKIIVRDMLTRSQLESALRR